MANILIVDDSKEDRKTVHDILKIEGNKIYEAHDFKSALPLFGKVDIDVILLDQLLPSASGQDILPKLQEQAPHAKIIFLTIVPEHDLDVSKAEGYVQKPFDPSHLSDSVQKVMKRRTK